MLLVQRTPSVNWEPLPLEPSGQLLAWVWFRPPAIPNGLTVVLPRPLFTDPNVGARLSIRQLVTATGLDSGQIQGWSIGGMNYDSMGGTSPILDQPVPPTPDGRDLEVSIWMNPVPQAGWPAVQPFPIPQAIPAAGQQAFGFGGVSNDDRQLLDAIESSWNSIMQLEMRVGSTRKELTSAISRLNTINRDLNTDERRFSDSSDLQDWQDARRSLRDSVLVLSKSVKEIDLGTTSGAGRRHYFDEIYRNHAVPKVPFPGLVQAANEVETYRKILQSVLASAQASVARAGRDAESRANSVLQRIASKVRNRRRKT